MMERCYLATAHNFAGYGGVGVSVCRRWHSPENFIQDVKTLPHWWYKEHDWDHYELDKDYFSSNQYSPETCVWLRTDENNLYTKNTKVVRAVDPEGNVRVFLGSSSCARQLGISKSSMSRFLTEGPPLAPKGNNRRFIGWSFEEVESEGALPRLALIPDGNLGPVYGSQWRNWNGEGRDQIATVIEQIKSNPDSRRHIVSAWNVSQLDEMALVPCHLLVMFYVSNGKLSCHFIMRSVDVGLGLPFNIASYALLTHMVAQVCSLDVGELLFTGNDVHMYLNHVDQLDQQLLRKPFSLPTLWLNPEVGAIDAFTPADIRLENYRSHPTIKMPIAV